MRPRSASRTQVGEGAAGARRRELFNTYRRWAAMALWEGDRKVGRKDTHNSKEGNRWTLHTHRVYLSIKFAQGPPPTHTLRATRMTWSSKLKISKNGFHYLLSDKIYFPSSYLGMLLFICALALETQEVTSMSLLPLMPSQSPCRHTPGHWLPLPPSLLNSTHTVLAPERVISCLRRASWMGPWPPEMVSCSFPII